MTATALKTIPTYPVTGSHAKRATRPAKPANYDRLEYADQVKYHVAVIRWEEAHPEIVRAEREVAHEKRKADDRAKRAARIVEIEADIEAGSKMASPPVEPMRPVNHDDGGYIYEDDYKGAVRVKVVAYNVALRAYRNAKHQYDAARGDDDNGGGRWATSSREELETLRAEIASEEARAKANAEFFAKYGDGKREPPKRPLCDVSYEMWDGALDAWRAAHPEVVARRKAKQKAEYDAWIAEGSPEALEAAATDAETEKSEAEREAKAKVSEARRIKREAKDPAAAFERALNDAKREAMNNSGDKDEARKEARENGESWSDIKDDWEVEWLEINWTAEDEAVFIVSFEEGWLHDHGAPFPELEMEAA